MYTVKTAFVAIGDVGSPNEAVERMCGSAQKELEVLGVAVTVSCMVKNDPAGDYASQAIEVLSSNEKDFDSLVMCVSGWISNNDVITVADRFRHKPMVLWGLTGYQEGGRLHTLAPQAGTTALRKAFEDLGFRFRYVYNPRNGSSKAPVVARYLRAASTASAIRGVRIGSMGARDMNLYGTTPDIPSLRRIIGIEVEYFEMLEMTRQLEQFDPEEVQTLVEKIKNEWEFENQPAPETLRKGVKWYFSILSKMRERRYEGVTVIEVFGMKILAECPSAICLKLLTDFQRACCTPENDILGVVTQIIVRYLTGQVAAYLEFYEFSDDRVLMGVPDFVPSEIVDGKCKVRFTAWGGSAEGALELSRLKTGRVTLARLGLVDGKYRMHIVKGEAVLPDMWEEEGWAPPLSMPVSSLDIILDSSVEDFAQKVMCQHYIIMYGDHEAILKDFCEITGVQTC